MKRQRRGTSREAARNVHTHGVRNTSRTYRRGREQGQRTAEERGGERVRQGGRYTTQREDRRYIYVRKVYVYVRNCLPVRSLSSLGEVGRPLGEQSRPTASSRATCLARTSSPGVSSLGGRRCEPSSSKDRLPVPTPASLGYYLAHEIG